ncbi:hypothetical protein MKX01_032603 [Papaver californicum]|nr:hypothetical protein MKX01_032603 [Papaver californicum]
MWCFGSPKQDACRRDLTINSLFYHIKEKTVEDFTGRGIADLKAGKNVTPLPPMETFLDDPLRVFRAIRFAARFGFLLDEGLKEAAASNKVRDMIDFGCCGLIRFSAQTNAIKNKINRGRIADEIDLMMCSNRPLFWVAFALPELTVSEGCDRLCVAYVDAAWNLLELIGCSSFDDMQRRLYLTGNCVLHHYGMVGILHTAAERFTSLIPLLTELSNTAEAAVSADKQKQLELGMHRTLFTTVENAIVKLGLEDVWEEVPLVDGKEIMAILQLKKGESIVGEWKQKLLEWQLADPSRTPEQSLDWMRGCHSKCSELE